MPPFATIDCLLGTDRQHAARTTMTAQGIGFPVFAKPDRGYKG